MEEVTPTEETQVEPKEVSFMSDESFAELKEVITHNDIHSIARNYWFWKTKDKISPEQEAELNDILRDRQILRALQKGLKGFNVKIGDNEIPVVALNEKNAVRKVTGERVKPKKVVYCNDYSCNPKKHHKI